MRTGDGRTMARRVAAGLILSGGLLMATAGVAMAAGVSMVDDDFNPSRVTVTPGEAITFTNAGESPHTATADDGTFNTGTVESGASATVSIDTPGTYRYFCRFHGAAGGIGMSGTITVTGGAAEEPGDPAEEAPDDQAGGGVAGAGGNAPDLPQTATPLPLLVGAGVVLMAAGLWVGRRRQEA